MPAWRNILLLGTVVVLCSCATQSTYNNDLFEYLEPPKDVDIHYGSLISEESLPVPRHMPTDSQVKLSMLSAMPYVPYVSIVAIHSSNYPTVYSVRREYRLEGLPIPTLESLDVPSHGLIGRTTVSELENPRVSMARRDRESVRYGDLPEPPFHQKLTIPRPITRRYESDYGNARLLELDAIRVSKPLSSIETNEDRNSNDTDIAKGPSRDDPMYDTNSILSQMVAAETTPDEVGADTLATPPQTNSETTGAVVRTTLNEEIRFMFSEHGWVFMGGDMVSHAFKKRTVTEKGTEFTFVFTDTGRYQIRFQRQDLTTGTFEGRVHSVDVLPKSEENIGDEEKVGQEKRLAEDRTDQEGNNLGSSFLPASYLNEGAGSPESIRDMVMKIMDTGKVEDALRFWSQDLYSEEPESKKTAMLGLLYLGIAQDSVFPIVMAVSDENTIKLPIADAIEAAEIAFREEEYEVAQKILLSVSELWGAGGDVELPAGEKSDTDRIYYLLGQIYETESSLRDERKAVRWYQRLVSEFPRSEYRAHARDRIEYLKRFFLEIR